MMSDTPAAFLFLWSFHACGMDMDKSMVAASMPMLSTISRFMGVVRFVCVLQ